LREQAEKAGAKWEALLAADAEPGGGTWGKLMVLVRRAVPQVEAAIYAACQVQQTEEANSQQRRAKNQEPRTVLMVFPGLLVRYGQMDLLARVREKVGRPDGIPGLWMLIAADAQTAGPMIDGTPVPVIGQAEWARIPDGWLRNVHRSNGARGENHG